MPIYTLDVIERTISTQKVADIEDLDGALVTSITDNGSQLTINYVSAAGVTASRTIPYARRATSGSSGYSRTELYNANITLPSDPDRGVAITVPNWRNYDMLEFIANPRLAVTGVAALSHKFVDPNFLATLPDVPDGNSLVSSTSVGVDDATAVGIHMEIPDASSLKDYLIGHRAGDVIMFGVGQPSRAPTPLKIYGLNY